MDTSNKLHNTFMVFKRIYPKILKYSSGMVLFTDLNEDLMQLEKIISKFKTDDDTSMEVMQLKDLASKYERVEFLLKNYNEEGDIKRLPKNKDKIDELNRLKTVIRDKTIKLGQIVMPEVIDSPKVQLSESKQFDQVIVHPMSTSPSQSEQQQIQPVVYVTTVEHGCGMMTWWNNLGCCAKTGVIVTAIVVLIIIISVSAK